MRLKKTDFLLISLIIVIGIFFSFYHLSKLYPYNFDQERDYLAVKQILDSHRPVLIGPRVVSAFGFFLGPWYYYVLLPFYLIVKGDPLFGAYLAGVFNILTALAIYFLIRKKTRVVALSFALIWLTPLSHRISWNVTFVPLFVIALIWLLQIEKPTIKHASIASLLVGFGINFHFQMVFFVPLLFAYFIYHRKTIGLSFSHIVCLLLSLIIPFLPLLFFDLRHNFVNLLGAFWFFEQKSTYSTSLISRILFSFRNLIREFNFALPSFNNHNLYKYVLVPVLLAFFTVRSIFNKSLRWLVAVIWISVISLFIYSQPFWPEYYQLSAVVSLFILLAFFLSTTKLGKILATVLMLSIVLPAAANLTHYFDNQSYDYKRAAMLYILEDAKPNRPNIAYDFTPGEGYGFGTIREYYENKNLPYSSRQYLIAYSNNKKHNTTMKGFGAFGVSLLKK